MQSVRSDNKERAAVSRLVLPSSDLKIDLWCRHIIDITHVIGTGRG